MEEFSAKTVLFEQRFWLQIMGDHARFIFYSLSPNETGEIPRARTFIFNYDSLLSKVSQGNTVPDPVELNSSAQKLAYDFKSFLLQLLALTLSSGINISLSPTFFNHMLDETEEYLTVMNLLNAGQAPVFSPLHHHLLWLSDAAGHAAALASLLDEAETDFIESATGFESQFNSLYLKSIHLNGYTRTKLKTFPALERLNQQSALMISSFRDLLEQLKVLRKNGSVLGALMPLTADHMAREECYYLLKLSETAGITIPDCDPARPRFGN